MVIKGKRTYIVAGVMALFAVSGAILSALGYDGLENAEAVQLLLNAGAFVGLRLAK